MSENVAYTQGGGISMYSSSPLIINTVFWANLAYNGGNEIFVFGGSPEITYCDIEGGCEGEGNIDADPLFRDPDNDDFHLMATYCGDPFDSPCIDMGHPDILDSLIDCDWGSANQEAI